MAKFNECVATEEMWLEAQRLTEIIGNLDLTCINSHCGLIARSKVLVEKPVGSVSPELDGTIDISTNLTSVFIGMVCPEALELVDHSPQILRLRW